MLTWQPPPWLSAFVLVFVLVPVFFLVIVKGRTREVLTDLVTPALVVEVW